MSKSGASGNDSNLIRSLPSSVGNFTVSLHYDRRLYKHDIKGSIAHAKMLENQGIINTEDCSDICQGLSDIEKEIMEGNFSWREDLEDIHMNIENRLFERIGPVAGKLHTARSRNDQISTDMRMFVKDAIDFTLENISALQLILLKQAETNIEVIMPGYTHLQKAQPVLFSHHIMAYVEMLERDFERFEQAFIRADVMPLGSGALAGLPYNIDRDYSAKLLNFGAISRNSMDAVSDRDFLIDYLSAASICAMHLSRLAEEIVIWSTEEFSIIKLPPEYTTGSSIMPQKNNPDFAEISRGKVGRVYGNLLSLLTTMKALPLTYNRDLQEDKESFFDTYDTLNAILAAFVGMLSGTKVNVQNALLSANGGFMLATDIADYLVDKGISFRESHHIVAQLSEYAATANKTFTELSLEEYRKFSVNFDIDVYDITVVRSVESKDVPGGTATKRVKSAIKEALKKVQMRGK
jgi:argininosuccinate lyase